MTTDLVKNGYDEIGERYANDRGHWPSNRYLGRFSRNLPRTAKILDLGCGTGVPIDRYLIGKGHEVVGLDISDRQLALARKNNPAAQYEAKDMQGLRDSEYSVDGLVSMYAIFHTPRETHQELFQKLRSFLPKGGVILVSMGASEWEGSERDFYGTRMFWSHFGPEKNRSLIEACRFKVALDEIDEGGDESHQFILARAT